MRVLEADRSVNDSHYVLKAPTAWTHEVGVSVGARGEKCSIIVWTCAVNYLLLKPVLFNMNIKIHHNKPEDGNVCLILLA